MEIGRVSRDARTAHLPIEEAMQSEQNSNARPPIHDSPKSRPLHRRFYVKNGKEDLAQDRIFYVLGEPAGGSKRVENDKSVATCRDWTVYQVRNL